MEKNLFGGIYINNKLQHTFFQHIVNQYENTGHNYLQNDLFYKQLITDFCTDHKPQISG